jgi:hypothetical protein
MATEMKHWGQFAKTSAEQTAALAARVDALERKSSDMRR